MTTPQTIGQYTIVKLLGEGGGGQVHAAVDTKLQREVAIKSLWPKFLNDKSFAARFLTEAKNLARLNHPNIATLYTFEQKDDHLYMVMELVRGRTLEAILAERKAPLRLRDSLAIIAQATDGLAYAHEMGVIHRDIKPSNLMISDSGRVKVMDFGIARAQGSDRLTRTGSIIGTLLYMSPEQCRGAPGDERSDLYSLAVVLYEMLGGKPPFGGSSDFELMQAQVGAHPPPLIPAVAGVTPKLESAIMVALSKRPDQRFPSMRAFSDAIGATALRADSAAIILSHTHLAVVTPEDRDVVTRSNFTGRASAVVFSRFATAVRHFIALPSAIRVLAAVGGVLTIGAGVYFNPFVAIPNGVLFDISGDSNSNSDRIAEAARAGRDRIAAQKAANAKADADRIAAQKAANAKAEADRVAAQKAANAKAEADRIAAQMAADAKAEADRIAAQKAADAKAEADRIAAQKTTNAKAEANRIAAQKAADAKAEADRVAQKAANAKAEADRIAAQKAANVKAEADRGDVARVCDAERDTLSSVRATDLSALKGALERATCEAVRVEARLRIARLQSNPQPSLDVCEPERRKVVAIDLAAVDAGRQLQRLQEEFVCPTSQAAAKEAAKTFGERTRSAQSELARIGCYDGPVSGKFDDRTRASMTRYLVAKRAAIMEARLTDEFLSELKRRGLGSCSAPPQAPVARLPDKEEPPIVTLPTTPMIKRTHPLVEEPSTHQRRLRPQPVERDEPSRHNTKHVEPAEAPPHSRRIERASRQWRGEPERPVWTERARRPRQDAATARPTPSESRASSSSGQTHNIQGVGF